MKYTLYKPNSKNSGSAFSFDLTNDRNNKPVLFVSMIQQYSWNDSTKNGSFKENAKNPEKSATIMLNETEAGEFLSSFKVRIPYVAFHKREDSSTIIKLNPWDKKRKVKEKGEDSFYTTPAWGLSVSKNSSQLFQLPIEGGEAEALSELLKAYIGKVFEFNSNAYKRDDSKKQYQSPQSQNNPPKKQYKEDLEEDDVPF